MFPTTFSSTFSQQENKGDNISTKTKGVEMVDSPSYTFEYLYYSGWNLNAAFTLPSFDFLHNAIM